MLPEQEARYLALLPQRHRDEWQRMYQSALDRGLAQRAAEQEAWRAIGVSAVPDGQGNFVPIFTRRGTP